MKIHVMQIKNHKILISIDDATGEKKEMKKKKLQLCALILKIYFIQVLLKAVFIQENFASYMIEVFFHARFVFLRRERSTHHHRV